MSMLSFAKKLADYTSKTMSKDPGKMLLWTGTLGWILSSAAQITAIQLNHKIPKDQKKFMFPQEMADAVINIGCFFAITQCCTALGKNLVKSGKLSTPAIRKYLDGIKNPEIANKIKNNTLNIDEHLLKLKPGENPKVSKEFEANYDKLFSGVSFIASTTGSVIGGNLLTPVLRNKFASNRQKQGIAEDKSRLLLEAQRPVLPMQNDFDSKKRKAVNPANAYSASVYPPSGSMKI